MIQQLILNTLMACHPKSEGVVVSSVNVQPEPEVQTDRRSATSDDSAPSSPEAVSTESVPTVYIYTPLKPKILKQRRLKRRLNPIGDLAEFSYTEEELAY